MNKTWVLIGIAVLAGGVLVGGGIWVATRANPQPTPQVQIPEVTTGQILPTAEPQIVESTPEADTNTGKEVDMVVEASNYKFIPAMLKVKKGDVVRLTLKNSQGIHDLVIDELDVKFNQIGDGDEEEVEFVASKTGTFDYYCSVGNHRKMGMVGKLIVE